jgi:flavin reductase (DIM6/NTAB) family NADH-FMN oxidoreductase RutF
MDNTAMYKLSYGLYVLSAREGEKDNACIVNTAIQVTSTPNRISVAVNKSNYTNEMITRTGLFNVSCISQNATFDLFKRYGFQSGRDTDKTAGLDLPRGENGLIFIPDFANAYISGKVVNSIDLGSHTLFIADVTDCRNLSDVPSVTYAYYQSNIKPQPEKKATGYRCRICGYVYEGEELPPDFVCPICKHGASDFEKI